MKKNIALFLTLFFVLTFMMLLLAGCNEQVVLDTANMYSFDANIHSLEIRINAADFTIKQSEKFAVESNLKYLSVSEEDGVLTIREEVKNAVQYTGAMLTLYVPEGTVFENANITTGAANLIADTLSAKSLQLQMGAGDTNITNINVDSVATIKGGAGKITIAGGRIHNLELELGMGECNLTAVLLGNNDLTFGIGASNLTLMGNRDDYRIDMKKGIGSITVDGKKVTDFGSYGNGQNYVQMKGGVGAIHLKFQESENR